jgi:hypothetical protein
LFAASAHVFAQQATSENPLNDLLKMQMNWDESRSNDNAKPSITLKFVPYDKQQRDGKTFTSYYVYANGLPTNKPYILLAWQIGWDAKQPPMQPVQSDLYVNARGVVMCRKPTEKELGSDASDIDSESRLNVISAGSLGEPVRYALYTENDGVVAMGRVIVNPIQAEDKSCHLQAILAVGGGEVMLVEGSGFPAKSTVELSSGSGAKLQSAKFKTDENGRMETAVLLIRKGDTHGSSTISMKSDSCAPSVNVNWGPETYKVK